MSIWLSEAVVYSVGGHQTNSVPSAGFGHVTHCRPFVLIRVVQEHLVSVGAIVASVATCSASRFKNML